MFSKILIVALATLTLFANGSPTGGPPSSGRDPSKDYYLKTRTVNASSPFNNLYLSVGNGDGFAFWGPHDAFTIAFLPAISNNTLRAYMNGTHQAFDLDKAARPGSTYALGSSYFQGPDPDVPSTADIFEDGTPEQDPIDVTIKNSAILGYGGRQWLVCDQHDISPTTPPTLEIPNSGPFRDVCDLADLVQESIAQ